MKNLSKFLKACQPNISMSLTMFTLTIAVLPSLLFTYGLITEHMRISLFALYHLTMAGLITPILLPVIYWSGIQSNTFALQPTIEGKSTSILLRDEENITVGILLTIALILAAWPLVCLYYLSMQLIIPRGYVKFSKSCVLVYEKQDDGSNELKGIFDDSVLYLGHTGSYTGITSYVKYYLPISGTTTAAKLRVKLVEAVENGQDYVLIEEPFKVI